MRYVDKLFSPIPGRQIPLKTVYLGVPRIDFGKLLLQKFVLLEKRAKRLIRKPMRYIVDTGGRQITRCETIANGIGRKRSACFYPCESFFGRCGLNSLAGHQRRCRVKSLSDPVG